MLSLPWIPTTNHSSRLGERVRLIVLHDTEGMGTARTLGAYWNRDGVQASSHAGSDDTELIQYVPYDRAAWTVRNGNQESDNIEMCGGAYANWTREQWLTRRNMIRLTAQWAADRCKDRGLPPRWLTVDEVRAAMLDDNHPGGICMHWDYTNATGDGTHWDLGNNFPRDVFMTDVAEFYGGTPVPAPAPAPPAHPGRFSWTLPSGHYYGNIHGPAQSHGGYYASERDEIRNIQQWLIFRNCVAGVPASSWSWSRWADGIWEGPTDGAMKTWHDRYYPGQPKPYQCWRDDYDRLTRI